MPRSLSVPYYPNPTPLDAEDLPRYLEDEVRRIREAMIAQPVAMTVDEIDSIVVTTDINWLQVFIGETADWDVPGGSWDPTTGVWTCPQSGLYSTDLQAEIQPFGAGNKNYYAGIAITRDRGGALLRWENTDGGDDAIPLGVTLSGLVPYLQGDKIHAELTVVHDQFVGVADYKISMQLLRVSDE